MPSIELRELDTIAIYLPVERVADILYVAALLLLDLDDVRTWLRSATRRPRLSIEPDGELVGDDLRIVARNEWTAWVIHRRAGQWLLS